MPRLVIPRLTQTPKLQSAPKPTRTSGNYYTREEVLTAVGTYKWDIACSEWGLVAENAGPNANGWCTCYIPGREDPHSSRPSGSFNFKDGTLQDRLDLSCISFFDLGVVLGKFANWQECRDTMGDRFIGKRCKESPYKHSY